MTKHTYVMLTLTDATVSFSQSVYSVNESSGLVTLEVLLSSQASFEITVGVLWFQGNATSESANINIDNCIYVSIDRWHGLRF